MYCIMTKVVPIIFSKLAINSTYVICSEVIVIYTYAADVNVLIKWSVTTGSRLGNLISAYQYLVCDLISGNKL